MLSVARGDQPDMHVQNLQRLVAADIIRVDPQEPMSRCRFTRCEYLGCEQARGGEQLSRRSPGREVSRRFAVPTSSAVLTGDGQPL